MRILYVTNSGTVGGMEKHVSDLVKGALLYENEVHVWCPEGPMSHEYAALGAKVKSFKIRFDIDPVYIFELKNYIEINQIDVVHAHELKAVTNALIAGALAKCKVRISHTHTPISEWKISSFKKMLNLRVNSFLVNRLATCEIALTQTRKDVKIHEGISPAKVEVIANGIDLSQYDVSPSMRRVFSREMREKYNIDQEAFVFGVISRLTQEKNHENLILAFNKVLQMTRENRPYLLIAGGGDLLVHYQKLVKELNLEDEVRFTGRFDDQDKIKLYCALDAFVFPSLAEGFGLVLIEAMAMGLPVVCSDLDVLHEVGQEAVFSYFSPHSPDDIADNMLQILKASPLAEDLLEQSRGHVRTNFSIEKFYKSYQELYEGFISR